MSTRTGFVLVGDSLVLMWSMGNEEKIKSDMILSTVNTHIHGCLLHALPTDHEDYSCTNACLAYISFYFALKHIKYKC